MKRYFLFLISSLMIFVAKLIPFSLIIGSSAGFFSGSTSLSLLIAQHTSYWLLLIFMIPFKGLSIAELFMFLLNRAPLFFACWSYRASNILVSVMVPIFCFFLFIMHPVGIDAWPYALYWLIPIIIYFLKQQNLFLKSLAAVFVAHAVGSVIWIYTHQMASEVWLGLIPIVVIERLLMAYAVLAGEFLIQAAKGLYANMTFSERKIA